MLQIIRGGGGGGEIILRAQEIESEAWRDRDREKERVEILSSALHILHPYASLSTSVTLVTSPHE